jgi:hypothetical protein
MMETMIRVPRMHGLPWQTFGSTEILLRQSTADFCERFFAIELLQEAVLRTRFITPSPLWGEGWGEGPS